MMKLKSKRIIKGLVSLLLVFTVMVSLAAPFDIVKAIEDETPATDYDIYAKVYKIDSSNSSNTNNLELVIQKGNDTDSSRVLVAEYNNYDTPFAVNSGYSARTSAACPWKAYSEKCIYKVTIRDRIMPTCMSGWFYLCRNLPDGNIIGLDKIDVSECTSFYCLFNYCGKIKSYDLSMWNAPKVIEMGAMFGRNSDLTSVNISGDGWKLPSVNRMGNMFTDCVSLESVDLSSFEPNKCESYSQMFSGCKKLINVKLWDKVETKKNYRVQFDNMFKDCTKLESVSLNGWKIAEPVYFKYMFQNCSSLKSVDFGPSENWGPTFRAYGKNGNIPKLVTAYESMFENCSSIESINLSCAKGAIESSSVFKGCTSLKELNLGSIDKATDNLYNYYTGDALLSDLSDKSNIFEGCEELAWIKLSEGWPAAGKGGTSVPPKSSWRKIDEPNKDLKLSSDELFLNFQNSYAGTWVADAFITFKGNGGTPNFQTVDGAKDVELSYDESEITASRNGYDFDGWWTEKTGGSQVHNGDTAGQWAYYAHWKEHKYNLVLDGNGGTVPLDYSGDGVVSEDRTTITFSNLNYTQFRELSKQMFYKNENSVLASWNTRKNGKGTLYYSGDSVNKLAEADGATATLFAQWHEPEAIIKFDSNGGSEINSREYNVNDTYGEIPESYKVGYTFMGWYTAANDQGVETKIESDSIVTGSQTLYAKWEKNPLVTFNANGGKINGENTATKVYSYNSTITKFPVPNNGSATLKGWYTAASGGTKVETSTVVTDDIEYFAQWGWRPKFETNGGSFTSYPEGGYEISGNSSYTIDTLPEVEKENSRFDGWYFGETKITDGATIDLSSSNVVTAHWIDTVEHTVKLKYGNGMADGTIKVYDGEAVGQLPSPKKDGCNFEGWYDGNDEQYTYSTVITDDVTLTAKWTQKDVTVTFDPCGGTMVDNNTVNVVHGQSIPSIPGVNYLNNKGEIQYRFGGWFTEPNGGGTLLTTTTTIDANTTYYAKWVGLRTQTDDDYVYSIHWATISNTEVTNTGGHLVFHPTVKGDINARLYISIEKPNGGTLNLPANSLEIKIPASLFDSDKEKNNLSSFFNASDSEDIKAKYSDDGQSIILYNPSPITQNTILAPEFNVSPTVLKGGYTDDNGYYRGDYYSKTFEVDVDIAEVTVNNVTTPSHHYERTMGLEVHTNSTTTVSKARADVSMNWDTDWGPTPPDANEYFYVVWSLSSTNTNCNQPYKLKWSEDTIHDGSVVYSDPELNTWSETYTSDGTHTSQVVTKHRRADVHNDGDEWAKVKNEAILSVLWNGEYEQQFRASRTAEVYVPMEGSGSFTYAKNIPDYSNQNKHSINGGQELILNGEPNLMSFPYEIGYLENINTDNPTWNAEAETYKTTPRTIVIDDGKAGDVMLSTDYGSDSRTWNSPYIKQLNQSDYYFSKLDISLTEYDAVYMDGKWTNPYENTDISSYGEIIVYARTADSDKLEIVRKLKGVNGAEVTLPENTVYFKVEHTSDYFTTKLDVNPTLYLTDSNHVRSLVSDDVAEKRETIVMNKCRLTTTREGEEPVVTESTKDGAWRSMYLLNISSSTLYAAKNCSYSNAVYEENSTEEFPVVIAGWNYNNSVRGYKKYIKSGIFNDLLPKDCTVDKSTVFVRPRESNTTALTSTSTSYWANYYNSESLKATLPEGYFSVTFKDNWEGSGRTMMTINVNSPDGQKYTGFDVFYKMKTTYSNINIYGINLINSVSFTDTTNGQSSPDARVGTKNVLDSKSSPYYNSIDSPQTAYATDKTNLIQPPKFQYGADSNVRAEGSVYSKHEVVGLNKEYNYNVIFTGGDTSKTANLILYDVIEKQIDGPTSEWHGEFRSLDISSIKELDSADGNGKCNPIVYYSTKDKDSFTEDDLDITKTDIWTTVKPADDQITAIAIDCRETTSGGSFVLDTKKSIGFNVNLRSPASERQSELETYNEAIIKGKIVDLNVPIISKARTGVTLRFANPKFVKSAFPESGTESKPESVVKGSVLEYVLKITNPDKELEMNDIVLEDVFSNTMKFNNTIKVQIGSGDAIPISQAARISSYSVKDEGNNTIFTATISSLNPGETLAITLPVTVTDEIGTPINNVARVKSINGVDYDIESNGTYHVVSNCKVKVLKVNGQGNPLKGAVLQILDEDKNVVNLTNDGENYCTQFTSTDEVIHYNLNPGTYYVHEVSAPEGFTPGEDIKFSIDDEGIITVGNEEVSHITVSNTPNYRVIFHEGRTDAQAADCSRVFKIYEPNELNDDKSITHFYDIPSFAGDEYVFAGWYHNSGYTTLTKDNVSSGASTASDFESDKYTARASDYHIYAKWIKVGKVNKDNTDANVIEGNQYRGFGLAGVQIRDPKMTDSNYEDNVTPTGMRFVTSISENLLRQIDEVSDKQVVTDKNLRENVEYGYVAATKENVDAFVNHYKAVPSEYSLQYKGENVNGVNTLGTDIESRSVKTDYRYITNVNCTSTHAINGKQNGEGFVKDDHRNFTNYRLYTLVVTYEKGDSASRKGESIDARAYIRYYDANGKLRVFYNNYNKTQYYGGCMCSFNQVQSLAIPVTQSDN